MDDINNRIDYLVVTYFDGNGSKFANEIGTSEANIRNYRSSTMPKSDVIVKICEKLEINYEWLLTGRGKIKKDVDIEPSVTVRQLKTDRIIDNQDIPLYDLQTSAGVVELFGGGEKQIPVDYIRIPKLPKCDGALYVTGDSMYPLLKSGDIVMYKEIYNIAENIIWGEMYLAYINNDGNEFFFTKFVQKSEREGYVVFVSQNQHHAPKEFPISSIKALAIVKASIRINTQL